MDRKKPIDRVAIITLQGDTADQLTRRLTADGYSATIVESRGGFLSESSASLLIGCSREEVPALLGLVREICHTRKRLIPVQPDGALLPVLPMMIETETCGATVVTLTVERFIQL